MSTAASIRVSLVEAWPDALRQIELELAAGTTLGMLLGMPQVLALWPDAARRPVGLFARPCSPERVLRDGDRVEFYRPLIADAKAARRERARHG